MNLPSEEVHVWLVHAEDARAAADRELRLVLARYLDQPPDTLRFERHALGKPALVGGSWLRFNLSHSDGLVAVAVARDREVGVDVEQQRAIHSEAGVARRIMTVAEHARYSALPEVDRTRFLLWVWARKEALVKAEGVGIRASLQKVPCEPGTGDRFGVVDLDVAGYAAAVAAEGHGWRTVVQERPATG